MTRCVLLTGATGFVGHAVAQALQVRGTPLRCILRRGTAHRLDGLDPATIEVIETDDLFAQGEDWWHAQCDGIDMVLHLAWYAEPGRYLTSSRNLDCLAGTVRLAEGATRAGIRRFVGVGTCLEYDLTAGYLTSDTALDPRTPYAAAKAAAWLTLRSWFADRKVSFLWARLFHLHGARENPRRLVGYLHDRLAAGARAALTEGTQIRDFMDVRDAAALLLEDAFSDRVGATNIASGRGTTVRALAESIADTYGRRDLLDFGARPENLTDPPVVVGLRAPRDPASRPASQPQEKASAP